MTTKEIYNRFCEANPRMSVFLQPWWLDAVYSEDWEVLLYEEGEQVLAAQEIRFHRHIATEAHSRDGNVDCIPGGL